MERDITVGDNVIISLNSSFKNYNIFKIDEEVIFVTSEDPNFLGAIVFENDIWKVYGTNTPYDIEFVNELDKYLPQLTGIIDIDKYVLEYLDKNALLRLSATNKQYYNSVYEFLREKVTEQGYQLNKPYSVPILITALDFKGSPAHNITRVSSDLLELLLQKHVIIDNQRAFVNSLKNPDKKVPDVLINGPMQKLTSLNLYTKQLTFLPESFGNLTNLTKLFLSENLLTSLPESFGNLTNVKILFLGENKLTSLPESFGKLSNLIELQLDYNKLSSLPESFGNLVNLTNLSLHNNRLTSLPESFGNLTNLNYLTLNNNQLTSLPESLGNLTNLNHLSLNNNRLTSLPESFGNLTNLTKLYLNDNNKLSSLPELFSNLVHLTDFSLPKNRFSKQEKEKLRKMFPNTMFYF